MLTSESNGAEKNYNKIKSHRVSSLSCLDVSSSPSKGTDRFSADPVRKSFRNQYDAKIIKKPNQLWKKSHSKMYKSYSNQGTVVRIQLQALVLSCHVGPGPELLVAGTLPIEPFYWPFF